MKRFHKTIFATTLTIIIIVVAYIVNAQLTNTAIIHNTGQISTTIWAKSGSAEHIQAAVDMVATAGGIVYVPAGNFSFNASSTNYSGKTCGVVIPGGVSVIGAGKDRTNLTCITYAGNAMFFVDGSNGKQSRISGITFKGYVYGNEDSEGYYVGYGVFLWNCKKFRVDHCRFLDFPDAGVMCGVHSTAEADEGSELQYRWNWGIVDHCDFDNPYKEREGTWGWGYGVAVHGPGRANSWLYNLSDILGKWDIETNPIRCALYQWDETTQRYDLVDPYGGKYFRWLVYIEGCTFKRCRHSIASNDCAFYVARHCTFEYAYPLGWTLTDVHGAMGNYDYFGGRGAEIYDCIVDNTGSGTVRWGIDYRGGGGMVFNNTLINLTYGVSMRYEGANTNIVCWVNDLWIWNNTYINVQYTIYDPYDLYDEEVHYFLRQRSNYTPYTYPHPLTRIP